MTSIVLKFASVLFLILAAQTAAAQQDYKPPAVGTQITWSETARGETKTRVSEVVASGPDFAIYLYSLNWDETRSSSYFAEFSGFHVSSCAGSMPSQEDRDRMRSLWPLQDGSATSVPTRPQEINYEVGYRVPYAISASTGDVDAVRMTTTSGDRVWELLISAIWRTLVRQSWPDGSNVSAIDVYQKPSSFDASISKKIGFCAALLEY